MFLCRQYTQKRILYSLFFLIEILPHKPAMIMAHLAREHCVSYIHVFNSSHYLSFTNVFVKQGVCVAQEHAHEVCTAFHIHNET